MAVIGRRRSRNDNPEAVLKEARQALGDLRGVLAEFRAHLDELEAEVRRQPTASEEV